MKTGKIEWYYKVASSQGRPRHGGTGRYKLPGWKVPGDWHVKRKPVLCESGWHVTDASHLARWLGVGDMLLAAQVSGERDGNLGCDNKICFETVRLLFKIDTYMIEQAISLAARGASARTLHTMLMALASESVPGLLRLPKFQRALNKIVDQEIKRRVARGYID